MDVARIPPIVGNEALFRAALSNLLDNAIKYSYERRYIAVGLTEESRGQILLSVENYGIRIPPEDLDRIFEPYYRSKVSDAKGERRGTGIGLAIVRHAVETVHKGTVRARSTPAKSVDPSFSTEEDLRRIPHKTVFLITLSRERLEELGRS